MNYILTFIVFVWLNIYINILFSVEGYIGDLCQTDNDCIITSSECRADCVNDTKSGTSQCSEKRCWCTSGYSFSPTQHTCLASKVSSCDVHTIEHIFIQYKRYIYYVDFTK